MSTIDDRILMEMDLVNRPNPWLPAYGFQIAQHAGSANANHSYQPTHEDLRANEMLQGDFLETILEETSDDLQSDSDRSGTTYWLGSDSETESVIHIKAGQRFADGELKDGSGSECNSVVPKKRRRKNNESTNAHGGGGGAASSGGGGAECCSSSGNSSRSSSLLQFESLERTCASSSLILQQSPHSPPFDSLEDSSHLLLHKRRIDLDDDEFAASPDSLEAQDHHQFFNGATSLRPCRSFESLDKDHHRASLSLANGYAYGKNCDLSRLARRPRSRRRDLWQLNDVDNSSDYSDYERQDSTSSNLSDPASAEEDFSPSRYNEVDQLLVFGVDPTSGYAHTASVDCRNSVDLRDFGLDSDDDQNRRQSTIHDLKSGLYDSADELSDYDDIDPSVQLRRPRRRHHHHHPHRHHHHRSGSSGSNSLQYSNEPTRHSSSAQAASSGASFNFRFADKWRSAPSLPASLLESTPLSVYVDHGYAASVPVSLELCGHDDECLKLTDDEEEQPEDVQQLQVEIFEDQVPEEEEEVEEEEDMAKIATTMNHDCGIAEDHDIEPGKMIGEEKARMRKRAKEMASRSPSSSIRIQAAQSGILMTPSKVNEDEIQSLLEEKSVLSTSTVKTQDRIEKDVLEIAMAMENDVDEAIRQLTKEVEDANNTGNMTNVEELTAALQSAQQMKQGLRRQRAKKNASYELAQQWNVDEANVKRKFRDMHPSIDEMNESSAGSASASPRPRRPLNNASYELAQQHDWMKNLSFGFGKQIYRMDACEEMPEPSCECNSPTKQQQTLRVSDIVEEMTGSASNLVSANKEPVPELKAFAKSTENMSASPVAASRKSAPRKQQPLMEETTLLDQLKKNSDFSCAGGDDTAVNSNNSNTNSPAAAPRRSDAVATLDDEVDCPCLLETKPIVICTETSYLSSASPRYSRSCEDVQWRKESRRDPPPHRHAAATATADSQQQQQQSTLDSSSLLSSSSPARAQEQRGNDDDDDEANTVQRYNEMSATAAKRLALSGEPVIRTTSSMNALNTAGINHHAADKEKKKSGFGGFLQRFSKLRFSGRSKVPQSEARATKKGASAATNGAVPNSTLQSNNATRKKNNEPDYIIIPLHPPADEIKREEELRRQQQDAERNVSTSNGRPPVCVSSKKPPLPPGSLRGVGSTTSSSLASGGPRRRAATDLGNPAAIEMAKSRMLEQRERPLGLLETDLDAPEDEEEAAGKKARSLLNLNHSQQSSSSHQHHHQTALPPHPNSHQHTNGHHNHHHHHRLQVQDCTLNECDSTDDVTNGHHHHHHHHHHAEQTARPHKSMEFLLDKENLHFVKPPENELQKVGERTPSEHELRVQRSLQRLNVPDWYKNSPAARDGSGCFRLKRHSDASQHATGWRALGSKTTSLSSLSSSSNRQPSTGITNQNNVFDGEALLSPSPTPPVFSRWSTSLLNSAGSSPANSARSSFNHRQPYLGWRSQERLANPRTPAERLAQGILPQLQNAKQQQQQQQQQNSSGITTSTQQHPANQEVRNSIKEVTSAIVHYVQTGQEVAGGRLSPRDWEDPARAGARSTSPRGSTRLVWMESSFVGVRPMDSPDVPAMASASPQLSSSRLASPSRLELKPTTTTTTTTGTISAGETSEEGGSTPGVQWPPSDDGGFASGGSLHLELEDLDNRHRQRRHHRRDSQPQQQQVTTAAEQQQQQRAHSTEPQPPQHQQQQSGYPPRTRPPLVRRRSEGSEPVPPPRTTSRLSSQQHHHRQQQQRQQQQQAHQQQQQHRRVSFESASSLENLTTNRDDRPVKCRNSKCTNSTSMAEARRTYKSCHNCTCLYCSRECRKAHWTRHRRVCLYSRASNLCIQVLSCIKKDPSSLRHVSMLARRGFLAHGRGAVKCLFGSPEAAEKFIAMGFQELGEPAYVKWSDVLPSEMGAELYAEAVRLVESYNPDTRLVVYVSVCVVREVPSSSGSVMWERQPVSRCAKLKLEATCRTSAANTCSSSATSIVASPPPPPPPQPQPANITREMESPETLVLTSAPLEDGTPTPKNVRELGFNNIQKHLKQRGVSLRRHFPQVYAKLCNYTEGTTNKFAPVTIYPRDQASGRSFMCIIMLDAEPERLQLLPTDSSRVKSIDVSLVEQDESG